mmetsp:Transcript_8774/g.13307  ORF Transcript_8774/g.13307 Transcript_8774/m.13307 type:complete len:95 (+) Transcript_8774:65-349(+)|eukprot:CAMPEP_0201520094 /NCGR_PEP_ID=MMETSP0161_2-20130828/10486_1 /ASSEMBLY_ACC=CAM_ASM_000251 /TAXON_ID=180227 /ORGANISM="Neoparamoeba aestuarina, Strain SoJaBio B1-5/56/2" /LENGTH=94 /DNA_ID=CAMNT_0047918355 /DNA_START=59 /DNA_END=343 /DNA_ORIENTATION=+
MSAYAGLTSLLGTSLFFYGFLHTGRLRYAEVETIKMEKRKLAHAHVVEGLKAENASIAAELARVKPEFEALKRDLELKDNPAKAKSLVMAQVQA